MYVAGFMAFKLHLKYPDLGSKMSSFPHYHQSNFPWIFHLSQGGLCVASEDSCRILLPVKRNFNASTERQWIEDLVSWRRVSNLPFHRLLEEHHSSWERLESSPKQS